VTPGREIRYLRDEASTSHAPINEAFRMQLGIGGFDGIAGNAKRFGERA